MFQCPAVPMNCRAGCGACCIAPSISAVIPGMPQGKPAGVRCIQLDENNYCKVFNHSNRPMTCEQFQPDRDLCADSRQQALQRLTELENQSMPD